MGKYYLDNNVFQLFYIICFMWVCEHPEKAKQVLERNTDERIVLFLSWKLLWLVTQNVSYSGLNLVFSDYLYRFQIELLAIPTFSLSSPVSCWKWIHTLECLKLFILKYKSGGAARNHRVLFRITVSPFPSCYSSVCPLSISNFSTLEPYGIYSEWWFHISGHRLLLPGKIELIFHFLQSHCNYDQVMR